MAGARLWADSATSPSLWDIRMHFSSWELIYWLILQSPVTAEANWHPSKFCFRFWKHNKFLSTAGQMHRSRQIGSLLASTFLMGTRNDCWAGTGFWGWLVYSCDQCLTSGSFLWYCSKTESMIPGTKHVSFPLLHPFWASLRDLLPSAHLFAKSF